MPEENTITLINDMATKAEIEVTIKDRLKGLFREGDTLYVYYSGHGIPADETPYLLPYDGDSESPKITEGWEERRKRQCSWQGHVPDC